VRISNVESFGIRTNQFEETVKFYKESLGFQGVREDRDYAWLRAGEALSVEIFGPSDEGHAFFGSGPVIGLTVESVAASRAELEGQGVSFFGPMSVDDEGFAWTYFRGLDGIVYELTGSA
jgi:catechol 2,3-dioxygenase-like lactoylglutathione lyase family enzyme